jgi:hypothetical protein
MLFISPWQSNHRSVNSREAFRSVQSLKSFGSIAQASMAR